MAKNDSMDFVSGVFTYFVFWGVLNALAGVILGPEQDVNFLTSLDNAIKTIGGNNG